jgi:hypothetical protein
MKVRRLNQALYKNAQLAEALTCPVNRHATMEEYGLSSDWDLFHNPKLLLKHYIENGGAEAFAAKRDKFMCEVELDPAEMPQPEYHI